MSWGSSSKCCLNCVFWAGCRRKTVARWECDHPGDRGQCAQKVFTGCSQGPSACQGTNCNKFVALPVK